MVSPISWCVHTWCEYWQDSKGCGQWEMNCIHELQLGWNSCNSFAAHIFLHIGVTINYIAYPSLFVRRHFRATTFKCTWEIIQNTFTSCKAQQRLFILNSIRTISLPELCKTHWHYIQWTGRFDPGVLEKEWLIANKYGFGQRSGGHLDLVMS